MSCSTIIYVKNDFKPNISKIDKNFVNFGFCGMSNKGGVGISFDLFGRRTVVFVSAHFKHGQRNTNIRNQQFLKIEKGLDLPRYFK